MIRIKDIKIRVDIDNADTRIKKVAKVLKIKREQIIDLKIKKRSIDARNKKEVLYVYDFLVKVNDENSVLKKVTCDKISLYKEEEYKNPNKGNKILKDKIVVVGMGPAGLFASYILLENGYKTLIIEQGKRIEERIEDVNKFWTENVLNPLSNVQFGEGGAGTFSDGKLNTLIKDKENLILKVYKTFVKFGASDEILYDANPHIGTDKLRKIIENMRNAILKMGGEILYQTKLTDLVIENNNLKGIIVNNHEFIKTNNLILAIGHSSRDTFQMIFERKLEIEAKPFAIGLRIMHPQSLINESQYGNFFKYLNPANYKLTYQTKKNLGVYTFCMCPGGYVVNASSDFQQVVVNGMSNYKRDTLVSNSAIVVTVSKDKFLSNPLKGIEFQKEIEKKAYLIGNGNIPIQLYKDFKENKKTTCLGSLKPCLKGNFTLTNLRDILPDFINEAILEAIPNFGNKIKGFDMDDSILAGVETRTSSPIRIKRDINYESNIKGIYPCGEGSGYSGGITTSAIDGIKVARKIIETYKPNE